MGDCMGECIATDALIVLYRCLKMMGGPSLHASIFNVFHIFFSTNPKYTSELEGMLNA